MNSQDNTLDLCAFGELLIDFVATGTHPSLAQTPQFEKCAGGAPANVAVGLSRLGGRSAMISMVGSDPFGDFLIQALDRESVDTSGILRSATARTTLAFVSVAEDGERDFTFFRHPGADTEISADSLPRSLIARSRVLHFGSLSLTHPAAREATHAAIRCAQDHSVTLSMDPNLRLNLWEQPEAAVDAVMEVLSRVQFLKVSTEELQLLSGTTDWARGMQFLLDAGPAIVILTRGGEACRFLTHSCSGEVPVREVQARDTTGAGDSFVAGWWNAVFNSRISLEELPGRESVIVDACRYAQTAASLTVQHRGAIPALPTRAEVEALLAGNPAG